MIEWRTAADWADQGLPLLPATESGFIRRAKRDGWQCRERKGFGGGLEYHYSSLPDRARAAYLVRQRRSNPAPAPEPVVQDQLWEDYEALAQNLKDEAESRLAALHEVEKLVAVGIGKVSAVEIVAEEFKTSPATIRRWFGMVKLADRVNWLPTLAPRYVGKTGRAECDPRAWDWYVGQYLTRRQPSHADTYRRLEDIAAVEGWVIPSAKTMERRVETDIDPLTVVLMREGMDAFKRFLPKQRRDEEVFAAGEAVNGDGLKFDRLWVKFPDGEILNTATAWFFQDLRTRKILAWRLGKTEHTDLFRLATYDLTAVCAPTVMWVDNTFVAANKTMSAGVKYRRRGKETDHEGLGLLLALGIEPRFTNPDKETGNPGSKPIERAFGIGGIHDKVATNPSLINRGYSKATAITSEELHAVITHEIARHNAQTKRQTRACRGVLSFDQAWEEATASIVFRKFSESQRRLLLMIREPVTIGKRDGVISIKAGKAAGMRNRFWCEASAQMAGRKVVAHMDPENLQAGVHVYSLDGRYLFKSDMIVTKGFNDTTSAGEWGKNRQRLIKSQKASAETAARMNELERQQLYANASKSRLGAEGEATPPATPNAAVIAPHFRQLPDPERDAARAEVVDQPGIIDFAAMAARQRPAGLLDDDDEQSEFMRKALAGVRAHKGLPPAE